MGKIFVFQYQTFQIIDVALMNDAFGSSGSFGWIVRSKCIGNNTFTGRRRKYRSKPTPIHGPVNKSELVFLYSRSHFSGLPQAFLKGLINHLSQKVSYASMVIDTVINVLIPNEERSRFHICDN